MLFSHLHQFSKVFIEDGTTVSKDAATAESNSTNGNNVPVAEMQLTKYSLASTSYKVGFHTSLCCTVLSPEILWEWSNYQWHFTNTQCAFWCFLQLFLYLPIAICLGWFLFMMMHSAAVVLRMLQFGRLVFLEVLKSKYIGQNSCKANDAVFWNFNIYLFSNSFV